MGSDHSFALTPTQQQSLVPGTSGATPFHLILLVFHLYCFAIFGVESVPLAAWNASNGSGVFAYSSHS
ncbi:hypothetical protein M413DRAFT_445223 [Hebeloma cylindrosporum]|uniref:Uncharacterized protein n=1 Tax=Hebeloma cylindrosporum TaxID=76867 RepID=A0A0C3CEI1_HEBCY|nr:hypothetical protein M413DRAFT_445223 [Hebeloma cylindrosporum h7]